MCSRPVPAVLLSFLRVQGTVMTGTVLSGSVGVGDEVELPAFKVGWRLWAKHGGGDWRSAGFMGRSLCNVQGVGHSFVCVRLWACMCIVCTCVCVCVSVCLCLREKAQLREGCGACQYYPACV